MESSTASSNANKRIREGIREPSPDPDTAWDDNKRHTDMEVARSWFDFIERNIDFDQLILETANGKDYWIHVSCRRNRRANRHQVIRYLKK